MLHALLSLLRFLGLQDSKDGLGRHLVEAHALGDLTVALFGHGLLVLYVEYTDTDLL